MIDCPRCDTPNPADSHSCSACGTGLLDAGETLTAPSGSDPSEAATDFGGPSRGTSRSSAWRLPEGTVIGGRYQLRHLLGQGGMGAVYEARDETLDRTVALKLIRPDLADDPEVLERFKREVHLASQVTHPNVLRVYDLGESDGTIYLTMQYVEGETLDSVLEREGALPVERALHFVRQICAGLGAAHQQGVVHRDLKPQNILLDREERVYVTDFGLARGLEQPGLTRTGATLGTPYYMSPEQVRGEASDARSDIYAVGVMLYEMLTGQVPFQGDSSLQVMMRRLQGPPRPAAELNPEIPKNLRAVLDRALAMAPAHRYGAVEELVSDLGAESIRVPVRVRLERYRWRRWLAAAGVAGIVAVAAWLAFQAPRTDPLAAPEGVSVPVVGVAPFANRSGDADLDWFGDGVAQLVIDNLAQSRHLRAVSADRMAALAAAADGREGLLEAALGAGIDYVVAGEILTAADGLTLLARILDTREGTQLTSDRRDGLAPEALLGASDEVALAVRRGLRIPLEEVVDAYAADFAAANPEAYEAYIAGLRAFTGYRYGQAAEAFSRALEVAPEFTMARYRLAHVVAAQGRTEEAVEMIGQAAAEAGRLPDREARYVRAARALIERRHEDAAAKYQEILERYPYETEARRQLAELYLSLQDAERAVEVTQALERLAPEAPTTWSLLGLAYLTKKDFSSAVRALQRYAELAPEEANAHHLLGDSYRAQGELDLAAGEFRRALELDPGFHFATVELATTEVLRDRLDVAVELLEPLVGDPDVLPRFRIDAAFALAEVRRAQGRFRDGAAVLAALEEPLAEERVREAMGLAVRGTSLLEAGDLEAAGELIALSIERSPGVPTRYLFARGLFELREGRLEDLRATAEEILEHSLPPDNPDRTEEKAAAYLRGRALLAEGDATRATRELSTAVALSGYEYRIYRLALAEAYLAAGRLDEALASARDAASVPEMAEPRLDLELDRRRAMLALAEAEMALGRHGRAAERAHRLLDLWSGADAGFQEADRAAELARVAAAA